MDPELQKSIKILVKLGISVLALVAVYLLFIYIFPILGNIFKIIPVLLMPFILAIIIAVLTEPVVNFIERKLHMKRSWAILISLILVVGGCIYLLFLVISIIIKEMTSLYLLALSHSNQIIDKIITSFTHIKIYYLNLALPPQVHTAFEGNLQRGLEALQGLMDHSINGLAQVIAALPNFFIFVMIATVATYFVIRDRALIRTFALHFIPVTARSKTRNIIAELFKALVGFLKAYSILISITTILTIASLKILGFKYALTIGIIVGLLDILPILGPGTMFLPWIIWQFMTGNTKIGISLLIVYIIISAVRQFLEPQIVGDNIGLHPLATLISIYVGLQLGGFVGVILGPICVVVFIACYRAGLFERFLGRSRI